MSTKAIRETLATPAFYGCVWPSIRGGVSDSFRDYVEESGEPAALDCSPYPIPTH